MLFKRAYERPNVSPQFKSGSSRQIVVALLYSIHDGQAFEFHCAVS